MKRIHSAVLLSTFLLVVAAHADEQADVALVKRALSKLMPNATPDSVTPAPMAGFYEVLLGAQVLYVSSDGRYVLEGDVYDLQSKKNVTDVKRAVGRMKTIQAIDESSMIVFAPKQVKHTITVFTDIDCGYCRKLHREINEYLERGIRVRYLAFPRSGPDSPSFFKAVGVWCAEDKKAAMTQAKSGGNVEEKKCNNPVEQHYNAGQAVGVSGTPTLVLENGMVIPGYVNAAQLVQYIEENVKTAAKN
jgi:thiol:disulfide interchange protein DsbC